MSALATLPDTVGLAAGEAVPLALYVHMPWCTRKCPYCDFNSHTLREALAENAYIDALLADLQQDLPRVRGRRVDCVFIGGGTPSLFSPAAIDRLLSGLRAVLPLRPDSEITLEANPGSAEREKFSELRSAGVNRLSIGVQSFDDTHLQHIGRIHARSDALRAVAAAHSAGFDNFNLDLMYALPGQSAAQAVADVELAIALAPAHISHYQLTLEPNTYFHRYPPDLPDQDAAWLMQTRCERLLAAAGYRHYEISAYARPRRRCRHNLNYWRFGDYLGIGAGAHGKLTEPARGRISRLWKLKNPRDYLHYAHTPKRIGDDYAVPTRDLGLEFMMNALRLTEGVPVTLFVQRTGLSLGALEPGLSLARQRGLLIDDEKRLRTSERGRLFLDDLLGLFLPATDMTGRESV